MVRNDQTNEADITNRFENDTPGYKDIALKFIKGENDPIVRELQLLQPTMVAAKDIFHVDYDRQKDIKDKLINSQNLSKEEIAGYEAEIVSLDEKMAKGYAEAYVADTGSPIPALTKDRPITSIERIESPAGSPVNFSKPSMQSAAESLLVITEAYLSSAALSPTERASNFLADSGVIKTPSKSDNTSKLLSKQDRNRIAAIDRNN